ncbi:unnamed protein product [Mycena citricolor]|uniref:Nucleoporin Pom152 n=1 Tax=Mycena citricolor TaxID=2018698 RepID=A0AAD2GYY7_9AGAR|nr:unnamed protein product [Mycena citricolor]
MSSRPPLIPEQYLDIPSQARSIFHAHTRQAVTYAQRLYLLSLGFLCQAVKAFDFLWYLTSSPDSLSLFRKWLLFDVAYCLALTRLRIPRLNYNRTVVFLQLLLIVVFDGLMFGGITVNLGGGSRESGVGNSNLPDTLSMVGMLSMLSFGLLGPETFESRDSHLLGQHTIRMSPISTARLNPQSSTFCLAQPGDFVLIPVLLNNTDISSLKYSLTPLGFDPEKGTDKVEKLSLSLKELKSIEQARLEATRPSAIARRDQEEDYDEYADDDGDTADDSSSASSLQKTQSVVHIKLSKYGTVRLEQVMDSSNVEARLGYSAEATVVPCPQVRFLKDTSPEVRCAGQNQETELMIEIRGVPPLSLRWFKVHNERPEHFIVEGIDSDLSKGTGKGIVQKGKPQTLKVPLSISLAAAGRYLYALEEIVDALGNIVRLEIPNLDPSAPSTSTTRSFNVLRRPSVSFKHCRPGSPASLLIGSQAQLSISTNDADSLDAPWDVSLYFKPTSEDKKVHPWKKTISTEGGRRDVDVTATVPGEYIIQGVKGKWCEGDVLSPDTCTVIEKPKPAVEIEWQKIHECSGETGVSADLTLHGTPPFIVYYTVQRDSEPPVEQRPEQIATSRGKLSIQPAQAGRYTFTVSQVSDANYRRVPVNGPSIVQAIHPLASASLIGPNRRTLSSCAGNMVDVDVELGGTGPWALDVRVITPKGSETLQIRDILTAKKKLQIPVPDEIDRVGGTFDVDLVSVEDVYECKKPVTASRVSYSVRRVKPTARFYGDSVTILEEEKATLPLRLTGDGPWRLKYRRDESGQLQSAMLRSANDALTVTEAGLYRILEVSDSQCPGFVEEESSTFHVNWVPRPSAKLSADTSAAARYESYNGSHILAPICENMDGHIDLDLTGRPPFQIMYNIAQDNQNGGTKLLGQPTFSSIQPRTRFELQTSSPGRIYYEVKQIGDASYPLAKHKNAIIPRSQRLLFEQQVNMRPAARFRTRNRMSYCLNDVFIAQDPVSLDGLVLLEGSPPFRLELSVKNFGTSHVEHVTMETYDSSFKLNLPSYEFKSVGPHLVVIESVSDASNCPQAPLDPLYSSVWVDVAETAAIIPLDRREHYCVGEVSTFQLEGLSPWTIWYTMNGKSHSQEVKSSPFSMVQQQPGEFAINSIAHQQNMCKAVVTDLRIQVHPLPSAQVGHGKRVYQDIHEGDQAEILFTLVGEPPFTFTYQRAEPSQKKGGKAGKVLETHTVSKVMNHEYSIFSAMEGTWTITSIADRYCRYPQIQTDHNPEKQRR